jgi:pyridoxal biosynthesis lyase PdxS
LNDYKISQLTDSEKWLWISLILLAVKNDNKIPADFRYISRVGHISPRRLPEKVLKLCDLKLIAIKRIAKRYQGACLDKIRKDKIRKDVLPHLKNGKEVIKEKLKFQK